MLFGFAAIWFLPIRFSWQILTEAHGLVLDISMQYDVFLGGRFLGTGQTWGFCVLLQASPTFRAQEFNASYLEGL